MGRKRRHYAINKLPAEVRETVDEMVKADFTYREIADYIRSSGNDVSLSAIQRYAANLMQSAQALKTSQETFSAIMKEAGKYNHIDFTEPVIRLLCGQLLAQIGKLSDTEIAPEELLKYTIALIRAVAYKQNSDYRNTPIFDTVSKEFDKLVFSAIADEKPELYKELKNFLNSKIQSD
ncbi:MAG: DUF3486 family protein [Ruminococcus sp.]|nr:DUF3486 family protein [Ruminococcus sp.]